MFSSGLVPFIGFFQFLKTFPTDNILNSADVNLRCFFIYVYRKAMVC